MIPFSECIWRIKTCHHNLKKILSEVWKVELQYSLENRKRRDRFIFLEWFYTDTPTQVLKCIIIGVLIMKNYPVPAASFDNDLSWKYRTLPHVVHNCYQLKDRQIHEVLYQNQTLHACRTAMVMTVIKNVQSNK